MDQAFRRLPQPIRFGMIGGANTALDFAVFYVLTAIVSANFVIANIISTGIVLLLSLWLNAAYTFSEKVTKKRAALFIAVTLFGLWALQPLVIALASPVAIALIPGVSQSLALLIAKLPATAASLTWNFILYKQVVFKKERDINSN